MASLKQDGVEVKVISGDNDRVTGHVCMQVGIEPGRIITGETTNRITDPALTHIAEASQVFARISPAQKNRILLALKHNGHAVGFMGDGINARADTGAVRRPHIEESASQPSEQSLGVDMPCGCGDRCLLALQPFRGHNRLHAAAGGIFCFSCHRDRTLSLVEAAKRCLLRGVLPENPTRSLMI